MRVGLRHPQSSQTGGIPYPLTPFPRQRVRSIPLIDSAKPDPALTDEAIAAAYEIVAADEELHRRRADLNTLTQLLTAEGRRLNGPAAPSLPPMISRALYPADRVLTGADRGMVQTDWRGRYAPCARTPAHRAS